MHTVFQNEAVIDSVGYQNVKTFMLKCPKYTTGDYKQLCKHNKTLRSLGHITLRDYDSPHRGMTGSMCFN